MRQLFLGSLALIVFTLGSGCDGVKGVEGTQTTDPTELGLGDDCSGEGTCRDGLTCSGADETRGTCQYDGSPGTKTEASPCFASWECGYGLVCAADGTCRAEGDKGTGATGGACESDDDCQQYLSCYDGSCAGFQPPFWPGINCIEPAPDSDPLKIYFEVSRDAGEFYRLPFPNDIATSGGKINLKGHPNPGLLIEEIGNPVDEYFDMIENELDGFGTMSTTFFRFNRWPDGTTLKNTENVYIVNIDPDDKHDPDSEDDPESEEYGQPASTRFRADSKRGAYICHNWLAVGPSLGRPLKPNTTFAAILTTDIKDKKGKAIEADADMKALLKSKAPSSDALARAWDIYAPLRDYLKDKDIDPDTIAAAAVFTTGSPAETIPKVREGVLAEDPPEVTELSQGEGGGRYDLYEGKLTVPFYQQGTRPFFKPDEGGAIEYDKNGLPELAETEEVRFAVSVPNDEMPEAGWPIVIYAHGTGGSETSFVSQVAGPFARVGAAVIGLEQVMHGDRRGLGEAEGELELNQPEFLFYNFLNPRASRDSNVQAAADHFQLVRLVLDFASATEDYAAELESAVSFDPERIYFFGHSQGTQGPFLFAAHEPSIKGILLSGAGANLVESLLGKKNPLDIASIMRLALADVDIDNYHPLLNLIQLSFDPIDPANHVVYVYRETHGELEYPKRHVFMSYGIDDTYTPENTQVALVKSMNLYQWEVKGHKLDYVTEIESLPHTQTRYYGDGVGVTTVMVQYEPKGYDGHFVMFEHEDAIAQRDAFVETMITDGIPTLIKP